MNTHPWDQPNPNPKRRPPLEVLIQRLAAEQSIPTLLVVPPKPPRYTSAAKS